MSVALESSTAATRQKLAVALGVQPDKKSPSCIESCCCASCARCQEVDTVVSFYRKNLGYTTASYGACCKCACTQLYTDVDGSWTRIEYPFNLKDQSIGPNFKTKFQNGAFFTNGTPMPFTAPQQSEMQRVM
jgi:hypothetical protein